MRIPLCSALLLTAASAHAQGLVGGIVVDSATGRPLPCVDVALEDTTGRVVARERTNGEGTFQFEAPARGSYRYTFMVWHHEPMLGPTERLEPSSERARKYQLSFVPSADVKLKLWPDTSDSPPGVPVDKGRADLRYPEELLRGGKAGSVMVHYAVDSTGWVQSPTIHVRSATDPRFAAVVTNYLKQVRLEPARRDGRPVCALMLDQPFNFGVKP